MSALTGNLNFPTAAQVPNNSIMDKFFKQSYLGNQFNFTTSGVSLGTTSETMLQLIQNKSTTKSIFISLRRGSTSVQAVLIKYYFNPTFSAAGAAATAVNTRIASSNASISTCTTGPTVSVNGTYVGTLACPAGYAQSSVSDLLLILDPGQSLLVTGTALVSTTVVNSEISFYEL